MTPATSLNLFIEKLAKWLKLNQPTFVDRYGVTARAMPEKGKHVIRFQIDFEIDAIQMKKIENSDLIETEETP